MRGKAVLAGVAVIAGVAGPASGVAGAGAGAVRVVAGPSAATVGYATRVAVMKKGTAAEFRNLDLPQHDVVAVKRGSNGAPLFRSPLTPLGQQTQIVGAAKLAAGTYSFFCSLHPNMKGTLRVI
jgi:plastocyanin